MIRIIESEIDILMKLFANTGYMLLFSIMYIVIKLLAYNIVIIISSIRSFPFHPADINCCHWISSLDYF